MNNKSISYSEHNFTIKKSSIENAGMGLFANICLNKGDSVGGYTGQILTDLESEKEPYCDSGYLLTVCKDCHIHGVGDQSNYTRYINHHENSNAVFIVSTRWKKARVEATKLIEPDEEIYLDYGQDYWEAARYIESIALNR